MANLNIAQYLQNKKVIIGGGIAVLLFIPLIFFAFKQTNPAALSGSGPTPLVGMQTQSTKQISPTPIPATAILSFQRKSATSTAIMVDTQNRPVSAVQLAISFDPSILGSVAIKPGDFFSKALILINKIDYSTGTIFYAAVVPPDVTPQQGKGVVAWLTYNFAPGAFNPTNLQFLPNTKVTSRGIETSVLKQASSISIASTGN